jgi:hypothetical protein
MGRATALTPESRGDTAALGGHIHEARAQSYGDSAAADLKILNVALGLEHEAIAAYQAGAESDYLTAAASIMGNEAQHLTVLRQALGENPVPVAFVG